MGPFKFETFIIYLEYKGDIYINIAQNFVIEEFGDGILKQDMCVIEIIEPVLHLCLIKVCEFMRWWFLIYN